MLNGKPLLTRSLDGVFVDTVTIADAQCISGQNLEFLSRPIGIGVRLTLEIGKDFQPYHEIFGDGKYNGATLTDWGSAFVVNDLFMRLGITPSVSDDGAIPSSIVQQLIGKQYLRLAYVTGRKDGGKFKTSYWNEVAGITEGEKSLRERFKRSVARGYPKNYDPSVLAEPVAAEAAAVVDEEAF